MTDVGLSGAEVDEAPEHVTDGGECWCGPDVIHVDGEPADPGEYLLPDGRLINIADHDLITRLGVVYDFFELRDRMNARIHLADADDIRWSPITIEMENLVEELTNRLTYVYEDEEESDGDQ